MYLSSKKKQKQIKKYNGATYESYDGIHWTKRERKKKEKIMDGSIKKE